MKQAYKYTLGADPEVFVRKYNPRTGEKGDIIPICGLVGGTKDNPLPMSGHPSRQLQALQTERSPLDPGYKYQEDGVAYEFNLPPAKNSADFSTYIKRAIAYTGYLLDHHGLVADWGRSSHRFAADELTHENANRIGCDPDWSAYAEDGSVKATARKPFKIEEFGTTRFTGGHVHFGYDKDLIPDHIMAALVDALVYMPLLSHDTQTDRRRFYGKAGLYRPKDYGMEYRTMSPFWLNGMQYSWVGAQSFRLLDDLHSKTEELEQLFIKLPHKAIATAINFGADSKKGKILWGRVLREMYDLSKGSGLESVPFLLDWAPSSYTYPDHEGVPLADLDELLEKVG